MRKQLVIIGLSLALTACQPSTSEVSADFRIPKGLEDCSFYKMSSGGMSHNIVVVRCPLSSTAVQQTQSCGKGCSRNMRTAVTESEAPPYE